MLNFAQLFLPFLLIVLITLPLIKVIRRQVSPETAKKRLYNHIYSFFGVVVFVFVLQLFVSPLINGADTTTVDLMTGTIAQGFGFLGASLATGLSALGAGIAVSSAATAAIGAFSENEKNFGKSLIFVALGEGVAIYGLLISILIINKL